jgi:thymidylate kinase
MRSAASASPPGPRGRTVAFIGPDGAGKSTLAAVMAAQLGARTVYLGVNLDDDPMALPTTRLLRALRRWRRVAGAVGEGDASGSGAAGSGRPEARTGGGGRLYWLNLILEEWYRALVIAYHVQRGRTVLLDRHVVADYYPWDDDRTLLRRIHGSLLRVCYPRPDLAVVLDAPADLLRRRKGEDSVVELERRRRRCLEVAATMPRHVVIDASQPVEAVAAAVREAVAP